ncbi:type I glyceraldehyde-3-phosphate dehydrogenase [Pelotomaculum terephthalicicum JT]|uniref:type I glyceraldehyde-3-phosphate dehydrogenase n=1 Tax=Pelotomaculum TaxID=191373 RepID=UPI0009C90990|nr:MULTISPECIES: type I glyceraldehyde-3-phosphate dehydrogenase [Pelotomaculum]MCG9967252.1 type I glyceraldehyde-3-phosphate dehydrogenase [Pelotomaculum terephthalicicum JT]OPX88647.1 MAG: Glyceraldehyde-3-phosphate dehydrogenase [Pelotomaculum sp. PtaB.Bin117]OPY63577.1 MAG: Glyceraldehyde-3-phosphate dehydrogenase [Pelotomaculum sp. PtaU1.Bin065]
MSLKVGVNGFGRIGRAVFRAAMKRTDIDIAAVNDLTNACTMAHLLQYDSVHGYLDADIYANEEREFRVNGKEIKAFAIPEPGAIPWSDYGVDIVVESSGRFTDRESASKHFHGGAKKVVISAPAKNEDITIVMGVNEDKYDPARHRIISNASCTTNCLAPIVKTIHDGYGILHGQMTTIHSYTNDQQILDLPHKDLRRARAAAMSIIPTTTGAAKAVALVIPELAGKLNGLSMRVPTPNVSTVVLAAEITRTATAAEINETLKSAAAGKLKGILAYSGLPLVSHDYNGNPHSATIDALSTLVIDGSMINIVAWYDNEWGYSNRIIDLIAHIGEKGI